MEQEQAIYEVEYELMGIDRHVIAKDRLFVDEVVPVIPVVRAMLPGMVSGEERIRFLPSGSFGMHDPKKVISIPVDIIHGVLKPEVGLQFALWFNGGCCAVHVVQIEAEHIIVDANHPLAGKPAILKIRLLSTRRGVLTQEEKKTQRRALPTVAIVPIEVADALGETDPKNLN